MSRILTDIHKRYQKKGLLIISIYASPSKVVTNYAKKEGIPYLVALDTNGKVTDSYKVEAVPTIFLVDTKGTIRAVPSDMDKKSLIQLINALGIK